MLGWSNSNGALNSSTLPTCCILEKALNCITSVECYPFLSWRSLKNRIFSQRFGSSTQLSFTCLQLLFFSDVLGCCFALSVTASLYSHRQFRDHRARRRWQRHKDGRGKKIKEGPVPRPVASLQTRSVEKNTTQKTMYCVCKADAAQTRDDCTGSNVSTAAAGKRIAHWDKGL